MKKHLLFILFFHFSFGVHAITRSMHIHVVPISCQTYTYEVVLDLSIDDGSEVIFGGIEIQFGDGAYEYFDPYDKEYILINNVQRYYQVRMEHAFPGPGIYKISATSFNRASNIENMDYSVNTPKYVESIIVIDPFLGCNSTPELENFPFAYAPPNPKYFMDFSFIDPENDSASYLLDAAYQKRDVPAINYWAPLEKDELDHPISKVCLDPFTGSLFWKQDDTQEDYTFVVRVNEWRKVDGIDYLISSSIFDWYVDFKQSNNQKPFITDLQDAAIIVGDKFEKIITISDPENDSLQVNTYGDFFRLMDIPNEKNYDYFVGPLQKVINYTPIADHVRAKPYKAIYSATDLNRDDGSLNTIKSMYIWVAGREHQPDPPRNLMAQAISKKLINLYWNDSEDELGYILERADQYFPTFERLAILPVNSTYFNDSSVVENNTYQYRIRAVGTMISAYRAVEISTPEVITAVHEKTINPQLRIYPNPSNGSFWIHLDQEIQSMEILNLSGEVVWMDKVNFSAKMKSPISISPDLSKGIYILNIVASNNTYSTKIVIQ